MVVDEWSDEQIDRVFFALADRTRRDLLTRSIASEQTISDLARHHDMSWAAVQKHVAVLERAGLVVKERRGRSQVVHADPATVERARALLDAYAELWRGRTRRIAALLDDIDSEEN